MRNPTGPARSASPRLIWFCFWKPPTARKRIARNRRAAFFETNCVPFKISLSQGKSGFVTAFYEPELEVSSTPDEVWRYPIYRRPPELVDIGDDNRPSGFDPTYAFGRQGKDGISYFPDRRAIDEGYLQGRGLEIAWAKSKVDLFFVHVQGAARLLFRNGEVKRITYAAKAGHPFSPIGRLLLDRGELDPKTVSMQTIRKWLADHPDDVDGVLWHNRSYIFFREADVAEEDMGPIAAAKVPLVAGRALAVDRLIHTFGFPFFIHAPSLTHLDDGKPFARLMLALDTGSAIVGRRAVIFSPAPVSKPVNLPVRCAMMPIFIYCCHVLLLKGIGDEGQSKAWQGRTHPVG